MEEKLDTLIKDTPPTFTEDKWIVIEATYDQKILDEKKISPKLQNDFDTCTELYPKIF